MFDAFSTKIPVYLENGTIGTDPVNITSRGFVSISWACFKACHRKYIVELAVISVAVVYKYKYIGYL